MDNDDNTNSIANIGSILKRIYPKKAVAVVPKTSMDLRRKAMVKRILTRKGSKNG